MCGILYKSISCYNKINVLYFEDIVWWGGWLLLYPVSLSSPERVFVACITSDTVCVMAIAPQPQDAAGHPIHDTSAYHESMFY